VSVFYWVGKRPAVAVSGKTFDVDELGAWGDAYQKLRAEIARKVPEIRGLFMSDCLRATSDGRIGPGIFFRADPSVSVLTAAPESADRFRWAMVKHYPGLYRGEEIHDAALAVA
jgi:hypothetical protein